MKAFDVSALRFHPLFFHTSFSKWNRMAKKSPNQPNLINEEAASYATTEHDALAHLRRPLTKEDIDKVRHIEGFPIGTDEDIIALSDAPYYTACPNPFLEDFIRAYGKPYDEATDTYHREPFAADVSEGKNDPIYRVHSYHTKVPPKAIQPYIKHYTDPGDIVLDGFAGSGMTGIASQMSERNAILCDLAPAATFIAKNYNNIPPAAELKTALQVLIDEVERECGWMYRTRHSDGREYTVNYTILSEVFFCPNCTREIVFWALEKTSKCNHCGSSLGKKDLQRKLGANGKTVLTPVQINYKVRKSLKEKAPDKDDLNLIQKIEETELSYWYPDDEMMHHKAPWGGYFRAGYHQGYNKVSDFYTRRNLYTIASMWAKIQKLELPEFLNFVVTSLLAMRCSLRMPFREGGRSAGAINNLHIPSLIQEYNPIGVLSRKGDDFIDVAISTYYKGKVCITTQSTTDLKQVPENSIDYVFVDPPFGDNILYSELNFLWEAWLRVFSKVDNEAIVSEYQQKRFREYASLMQSGFSSLYRVLKPYRWMTVEFHNSQNSVWNAIQEAILSAGFIIADVRTLDKQQGSYKQVSTAGAVKQDLVISAYKPSRQFEQRFLQEAGTEQGAWDFIRQHLAQLPVFVSKDDVMEIVAERQNYLLFDRMVAFHIQRGASVPLSAAEFYAGLRQRFPERDGMYFTSDQVAEYDTKRAQAVKVEQLALFVSDEKSAVQWLRVQLEKETQTYQDIQPKFLRELHQARHEQLPELNQLLEENFLKDKQDRWYVPDPAHAGDLEKLRERGLLREFESYVVSKGKLKTFRTEAVRAGFKAAWAERTYATIIEVARRLPEDVLQEDAALLMYYDNAVMRVGG
jgi:DNA modification methylase